jgi:hypothetical protein
MRTSWKLLALASLALLVCTACPRPVQNRYTSADVRNSNRYTNVDALGGLFGGSVADGAAGGGEAAREVVEPDVVRRDGNILYVLNQYRGLTLVDLDSQSTLAQVPTYGFPRDLYVRDGRAYVLVGQAGSYVVLDGNTTFDVNARLYVVDVSAPGAAHVVSQFDIEGDLVDSRLVGDVLYAVGGEYQWSVAEGGSGGATTSVQKDLNGTSWVTSIDVADVGNIHEADRLSFSGQGTVIQATPDAIFVAASNWSTGNTTITYVDISDPAGALQTRGSATVNGQVADRFKMDAYNGVLRVVSGIWSPERRVNLTSIDLADPDNLKVLAEHDFVTAHGDSVFATRFDGPRGYVVTYFQVDPLYVLDLSDPQNPKVAGELEVPGWSTHIEPMGDRLLALGVDNTNGRRVSVSLFNVANPEAPSLVKRVSFGDNWSWSSAYNDVKAFAVFDGVVVVPFSGWNDGVGGYDRLQFLSFTQDDLAVRGHVDVSGEILRTLQYKELYYGVTQEELAAIDASNLDAPKVLKRITLAENDVDFVELSPALGLEVASQNDGTTVFRTVDGTGAPLGSVAGKLGNVVDSFAHGDTAVVVGIVWDTTSRYVVALVDCSSPSAPKVSATIDVKVDPYFGWIYPMYMMDARPAMGGAAIMPYYWWWTGPWQPQKAAFLLGDTLALRCRAGEYDATVGDAAPSEGVALVDLEQAKWTRTIGLGYASVVSVDPAGSKVIVGTREDASAALLRPTCAYYVTLVDLLADTPTAGDSANVPGTFVHYDPADSVLTLLDDQWSDLYSLTRSLRTVEWDGSGTVTALDELTLPEVTSQVLGRGDRVYLDAYKDKHTLYAATVASDGTIELGKGVDIGTGWSSLLDAKGDNVLVQSNGQTVSRYHFEGNTGTLADQVSVMAAPTQARFGENQAYLVMGYSGIVRMPL